MVGWTKIFHQLLGHLWQSGLQHLGCPISAVSTAKLESGWNKPQITKNDGAPTRGRNERVPWAAQNRPKSHSWFGEASGRSTCIGPISIQEEIFSGKYTLKKWVTVVKRSRYQNGTRKVRVRISCDAWDLIREIFPTLHYCPYLHPVTQFNF